MKLYPLLGSRLWEDVLYDFGRTAGTYRLRLRTEDLQGFSPINRLLGADPEGTLYIGTSSDLPVRLTTMKKAVSAAYGIDGYKASAAHGVGRMMSGLFVRTFAPERLFLEVHSYFTVESPAHRFNHYTEEWRLIMNYVEHFGEFPPLNGPKPSKVN